MNTSLAEPSSVGNKTPWAEFLFSRIIVYILTRSEFGDLHGYFESLEKFSNEGLLYGEDGFGYPILAFLFIALPWKLGGTEFNLYHPIYRAQCFLVDCLVFYLLSKRCSRPVIFAYILCTALLGHLLYHRLDIALGALILISILLHEKGRWKLSCLVLGFSVAFKIIPILLFPCIAIWHLKTSFKRSIAASLLLITGALIPFGLGTLWFGKDSLLFMTTHSDRGIQLESIWASTQYFLISESYPGEVYFAAGSYNLKTELESLFTALSHYLAIGSSLTAAICTWFVSSKDKVLTLAISCVLGLLLIFSKVLSPQFILFFLPVLMISITDLKDTTQKICLSLSIIICGLTCWVYPYHEDQLIELKFISTFPTLLRNILLVGLTFSLVVLLFRSFRSKRGKQAEQLPLESSS